MKEQAQGLGFIRASIGGRSPGYSNDSLSTVDGDVMTALGGQHAEPGTHHSENCFRKFHLHFDSRVLSNLKAQGAIACQVAMNIPRFARHLQKFVNDANPIELTRVRLGGSEQILNSTFSVQDRKSTRLNSSHRCISY